jgi:hypothetical protein
MWIWMSMSVEVRVGVGSEGDACSPDDQAPYISLSATVLLTRTLLMPVTDAEVRAQCVI